MADNSTFLNSDFGPAGNGYSETNMDQSFAEPEVPEAQMRAFHSRCFWLGKALCESYLAETVFEEADSSHTAMDLAVDTMAAVVDFPWSDAMEKLDVLQDVQIHGGGGVETSDVMRTFMTKVGVIMSGNNSEIKHRLTNLIYSRGTSTASARERRAQAPPSPPSSEDGALHDEKPIAMYTMRLMEWSQIKGKTLQWDHKVISLDPSKWQMTVNVDGFEFVGVAKKQKTAKHIASKNACLNLNIDV